MVPDPTESRGGLAGFRVTPGDPASPVVLHLPHAARRIPAEVRSGLLLSDDALDAELDRVTDHGTDVVAGRAAGAAGIRPWTFSNLLSRLVVDPERFPDDREPMNAVGMGAVYTRTSLGAPLRTDDTAVRNQLLDRWFHPYAGAMADLVDARLAAVGRVTVIDVHSYPAGRLPYEIGGDRRPPVCLGTDPVHTPAWLLAAARQAFAGCGEVAENTPFAGCYVPLRHYGRDRSVTAIMIEMRRDAGPTGSAWTRLANALARLIDALDDVQRR
ncbi:N-formylglutamate amidohydrolase [Solwaraspora sp. WMMD1047]|uniref:N-formylglutamate amidohydrolase n=1 Tax=Solwaraspora sp. WMMD1047 TaxID=3016102 RepID=UPI00241669EC|nr:N-formylglutamate amidohydrolase [Solwaraspora sp. WMMD1047]MDG4828698.1 N-formylglutamate amidohydrolase [Solwaraspora sp. WMMD1047]